MLAGLSELRESAGNAAGVVTKPVKQLVATTRKIAAGNLDEKMVTTGRDEIGELATSFNEMVSQLKRSIGIAQNLGAVGVQREHIGRLVDVAERDTCHQTNPRPCTRADFERFFAEAM